jgi:hypothetical protein
MSNKFSPNIVMSKVRDVKVVYIDPVQSRAEEFEARTEQDPRLQRITIYATHNLAEGRDLARKHNCQLAIYHDGIEGKDFVFAQMELRNAQPSIDLIPIINVPTVQQLSSHRRIGGIFNFAEASKFENYESFVSLVVGYLREYGSDTKGITETLNFTKTLQNFLTVGEPELKAIKAVSTQIIEPMILLYDVDARTSSLAIAAENLYSPSIKPEEYKSLLKYDKHNLAEVLAQTASWTQPETKPTSVSGLVITLSNYVATELSKQVPSGEILFKIAERPFFLKHPSLRTLDETKLKMIMGKINSTAKVLNVKSV